MADTATIIGENMRVVGNLSGDEDLNVFGYVEGSVRLTESLLVEPSGIVRANVAVRSAAISGIVVGNITASEVVEITAEGRMVGDITAPRVLIADGAAFNGHIEMTEVDLNAANPTSGRSSRARPRTTTSRAARPTPRPAPAEKPRATKPATKPVAKPAKKPAEEPVVTKATEKPKAAKETPAAPAPEAKDLVTAEAQPKKTRRRKKAST